MAWTAPATWSSGQVPTAANFNTHIRDNFNTLAPAVCTTIGDVPYATGANALTRLAIGNPYQVLTMNAGQTAPAWGEAFAPIDVVTQDAEILSNAAETAVYTSPDIGGLLGTTSGIKFEWMISYLNNTGSTQTLAVKIKLDSTVIFTPINTSHTTGSGRRGTVINYAMMCNQSSSSQKHCIGYQATDSAGTLSAIATAQSSIMNYNTSAVDLSTAGHYVTLTVDHGAANSLLSCIVRLSGMWLMRAV